MTSRKRKNAAVAARRGLPPQPRPRAEGEPFPLDQLLDPRNFSRSSRHLLPGYTERLTMTAWSDIHSIFYNGMLNVAIEPTRTLGVEILREMGIEEPVRQLIRDMGLGKMLFADYDLYPDLVRQFLATCEVDHDVPAFFRRLFFFCNGVRYSILVGDIGSIFGWDTACFLRAYSTRTLDRMESFWKVIAFGNYDTIELKIARIANPTLRLVAKALAHTFFCRQEPDRLPKSALVLLFTGLRRELRDSLSSGTPFRPPSIDLSWMFADFLTERKYRALGRPPGPRMDSIGSLITPILRAARVDLSGATVISHRVLIDRTYLANARIFRHGVYHWVTAQGSHRYCRLPCPAWTSVTTLDQLHFEVPDSEQCTMDGSVLPAFACPPAPPQASHVDAAADRVCPHGTPLPAPLPLTTDFSEDFYQSVPSLPAGASVSDWRAHYDQVQVQQTTMLRRIMGALSHVTWTPSPPSFHDAADLA